MSARPDMLAYFPLGAVDEIERILERTFCDEFACLRCSLAHIVEDYVVSIKRGPVERSEVVQHLKRLRDAALLRDELIPLVAAPGSPTTDEVLLVMVSIGLDLDTSTAARQT
jgi:hypothetical protein